MGGTGAGSLSGLLDALVYLHPGPHATSRMPRDTDVLPDAARKASAVRRMFGSIAPRYDLLNHLLSLNVDRRWRRIAVDRLLQGRAPQGSFLDLCAGTFDLSLELARRPGFDGVVAGTDFALPMLTHGLRKIRPQDDVAPACADALRLPFADASLHGAMVAFGVRNLADLDGGLAEAARVLRPGARLVVLEFAVPAWQPFRALYLLYFTRILPWIGRLVSRHKDAYAYLPASVLEFPEPAELARRMEAAGFQDVRYERRTGGIVAVHVGVRRG
jgi:demethylmenaquinone methyltransferase/2-methoxy-6-polyprenyl-1,4-benzoquinol methylase